MGKMRPTSKWRGLIVCALGHATGRTYTWDTQDWAFMVSGS